VGPNTPKYKLFCFFFFLTKKVDMLQFSCCYRKKKLVLLSCLCKGELTKGKLFKPDGLLDGKKERVEVENRIQRRLATIYKKSLKQKQREKGKSIFGLYSYQIYFSSVPRLSETSSKPLIYHD
jgi:hypothetical protein